MEVSQLVRFLSTADTSDDLGQVEEFRTDVDLSRNAERTSKCLNICDPRFEPAAGPTIIEGIQVGFISKSKTKNRMAPRQYPNSLGDSVERSWQTEKLLQTVSVMLGAQSMTSTILRGHQSSLVSLFNVGEIASDFWYERTEFSKWQLSLGADSTRGVALDWAIGVQMGSSSDGPNLVISTVNALTRDGALVKGDLHDRLRETIGESASSGKLPEEANSLLNEITKASYATPVHPLAQTTPPTFNRAFHIESNLTPNEVRKRLALLNYRVSSSSESEFSYEIGIEGYPSGLIKLIIEESTELVTLRGSTSFAASGDLIADAVAFRMCSGFPAECIATLKLFDGSGSLMSDKASEGDRK